MTRLLPLLLLLACGSEPDPEPCEGACDTDAPTAPGDDDDDTTTETDLPTDTGPDEPPIEDCADGRDNDGDGLLDCNDPDCDGSCPESCLDDRDNDGDGAFDCDDTDCTSTCDADGDGAIALAYGGADCDDGEPTAFPGAPELCDGIDNDCNGLADDADPNLELDERVPIYVDGDGDGYGTILARQGCVPGPGGALLDGDCDDGDGDVNPDAPEICNGGVDDDCDGLIDDADPDLDLASALPWYTDLDDDGYGDPASEVLACVQPPGHIGNGLDCHPIDPALALERPWWPDLDGDGYGAGASVQACVQPVGHADNPDDCDDADPALNPDTVWFLDADLDGWGDPTSTASGCTAPLGHVAAAPDCDDADPWLHPGVLGPWPSILGAWQADGSPADGAGLRPDATLLGDTTWSPGAHGDAFVFDGLGDAAELDLPWSGPFTLALWVRSDLPGQSAAVVASGVPTLELAVASDTYQLDGSGLAAPLALGSEAPGWVHLALAYDGVELHTWYDGLPAGSAGWSAVDPPALGPVHLATDGTGGAWFAGSVDEVLFFDRPLSDAEAFALYEGTAVCMPL